MQYSLAQTKNCSISRGHGQPDLVLIKGLEHHREMELAVSEFQVPKPLDAPPVNERALVSRLRAQGQAELGEFGVLQAALDVAAYARLQSNQPLPDFAEIIEKLNALARDAGDWVAVYNALPPAEEQVDWLRQVVVSRGGFSGATQNYDASENADIVSVVENRRGLPVSLGVIYIHLGRSCGFEIEGLNFPGHFLLRIKSDQGSVIFDPFNDAQLLEPQDLRATLKRFHGPGAEMDLSFTRAVSDRDVLFRMQNNLKIRALRESRLEDAVLIIERMLLVNPGNGVLWQEAGLTHQRLGNLRAAVLAFENAVETMQEPALSVQVQTLLDEARRQLN